MGTERGSAVSLACLRTRIDASVRKLLGVPYRHNGRSVEGLDCLGLIWLFYKEMGISVPDGDGADIAEDWYASDPERYLRGLLQLGVAVEGELKPLDLVYFRMVGGHVTHGGIMVDRDRFIHVLENRSVMVTRLTRAWRRRMAGARRIVQWQEQSLVR